MRHENSKVKASRTQQPCSKRSEIILVIHQGLALMFSWLKVACSLPTKTLYYNNCAPRLISEQPAETPKQLSA